MHINFYFTKVNQDILTLSIIVTYKFTLLPVDVIIKGVFSYDTTLTNWEAILVVLPLPIDVLLRTSCRLKKFMSHVKDT